MTGALHVGCSSWTSEAWNGRFYPPGLPPGQRLPYYARHFDAVEVDATYYAIPARSMVRGWAARTPPQFRFALKLPKDLLDRTHPLDEAKVEAFLSAARELGPKLLGVVAQFPPSFRPPREGDGGTLEQLERLTERLAPHVPLAIELRDRGWFEGARADQLYRRFAERNVALAWSSLTFVEVPAVLTTGRIYLRFIGDHTTLKEEDLGETRLDRGTELRRWAGSVRERLDEVESALVFFNNHFAGYAPATANEFLALLGRSAGVPGQTEVGIPSVGTSGPDPPSW